MPMPAPDDEPATCRLCGKPFAEGEARYRDAQGDVHVACHDAQERPRREAQP